VQFFDGRNEVIVDHFVVREIDELDENDLFDEIDEVDE
jgi:hypothetical protein